MRLLVKALQPWSCLHHLLGVRAHRQLTEVAAMADVLRFATLLSLYVGVLSLPAQRRSSRLWQWDQVVLEFRACIVVGLSIFGSAHVYCFLSSFYVIRMIISAFRTQMFMVFQRCGKQKDGGERESLASATSTGGVVDRRDEDT
ncbi:hypothetical protein Tco_0615444 [Tanacetum coccineum]